MRLSVDAGGFRKVGAADAANRDHGPSTLIGGYPRGKLADRGVGRRMICTSLYGRRGHPVRAGVQEHRRCPAQGRRLIERTRLHRADLVAPVPEVPRRPRAGQGDRGRAPRAGLRLHHRRALPLGHVGRSQGLRRQDRLQPRPHRRRPARVRRSAALPVPARLQGACDRPEHHRVQDRRDLRRDQEPLPERLQPARSHRHHRRAPLPAPRPRSTSCRTSTKPRSGTWATPGATAASTTRRDRSSGR